MKIERLSSRLNENNSDMVIDETIAKLLFGLEEENLSPIDDGFTDEEYEDFISIYVGKTLSEYAQHRNPDNPSEQLGLALSLLNLAQETGILNTNEGAMVQKDSLKQLQKVAKASSKTDVGNKIKDTKMGNQIGNEKASKGTLKVQTFQDYGKEPFKTNQNVK